MLLFHHYNALKENKKEHYELADLFVNIPKKRSNY